VVRLDEGRVGRGGREGVPALAEESSRERIHSGVRETRSTLLVAPPRRSAFQAVDPSADYRAKTLRPGCGRRHQDALGLAWRFGLAVGVAQATAGERHAAGPTGHPPQLYCEGGGLGAGRVLTIDAL